MGGGFGQAEVDDRGVFAALDVRTNRLAWRQQWREICYSGSIVTAGGLRVRRPRGRAADRARQEQRREAVGVHDRRRRQHHRHDLRAQGQADGRRACRRRRCSRTASAATASGCSRSTARSEPIAPRRPQAAGPAAAVRCACAGRRRGCRAAVAGGADDGAHRESRERREDLQGGVRAVSWRNRRRRSRRRADAGRRPTRATIISVTTTGKNNMPAFAATYSPDQIARHRRLRARRAREEADERGNAHSFGFSCRT